jgi:hypothetical protein
MRGADESLVLPASEASTSAPPPRETQTEMGEGKEETTFPCSTQSNSNSRSTSRQDILQSHEKRPGQDGSVYKMPRAIDTEDVDFVVETGHGLPSRRDAVDELCHVGEQ